MQYHYFIFVNIFSFLKEDMYARVATACMYLCVCFPLAFEYVD